jgi:hypothetical protein
MTAAAIWAYHRPMDASQQPGRDLLDELTDELIDESSQPGAPLVPPTAPPMIVRPPERAAPPPVVVRPSPPPIPRRTDAPRITTAMRLALYLGTAIFVLGTLVQVLAIVWIALLALIVAFAATILVHTGGLEPRTFENMAVAGAVIDWAVLAWIASIWIRRGLRGPRAPQTFAFRHPVSFACVGLALALVLVTIAGWRPSLYFAYPMATMVVFANAFFFALVGPIASVRLLDRGGRRLHDWAITTPYRAGLLTATLVLLGAAGFAARQAEWYRAPWREASARLELSSVTEPDGVVDSMMTGLCLAAAQTEPAHADRAPGCTMLRGE